MEVKIEDKMLVFKRVGYGKPSTLEYLREYRLKGVHNSPVGTLREIIQMIEDQNLDVEQVALEELDGGVKIIEIRG